MRRIVLSVLLALLAFPPAATAGNVFGDDEVVVALIDSGIRPTHQEFDYGGPTDPDDQIVAWWDFTATLRNLRTPGSGQLWDDEILHPYDNTGHGTATGALAVGRNVAPADQQRRSFFPGGKLAVARVCGTNGGSECDGDIAGAIAWASGTVGADVISVSIGSQIPQPEILHSIHEAASLARARGSLVVVANGNGFLNTAGPNPGWATPFANSTSVLSVGAADVYGVLASTDPEVASDYFLVPSATNGCNTCYSSNIGTSLATPIVAGMAARALATGVENGHDHDPDYLETLLKYVAIDTAMPPTYEGYGYLHEPALPALLTHAAAGTLPARPDPDLNALYVESAMGTLRDVHANKLDGDVWGYYALPYEPASPHYQLSAGVSPGLTEGETFTVDLAPGEEIEVAVQAEYEFFELQMFRGTGPDALRGRNLVANSDYGNPAFTFKSHDHATYTVLVAAFSAAFPLDFAMSAESSIHGPVVPDFDAQRYYAATSLYIS